MAIEMIGRDKILEGDIGSGEKRRGLNPIMADSSLAKRMELMLRRIGPFFNTLNVYPMS